MEIARLRAARQPNARRGEIRLDLTLNEYWLGRTARKSLALSLTKESRRPSNLPESVRLNRVRLQSSSKNPLLITRLVKGESWLKLSNSSERLRQINMFFLLRKMGPGWGPYVLICSQPKRYLDDLQARMGRLEDDPLTIRRDVWI